MVNLNIFDDNNNVCSYILKTYEVKKADTCVIVQLFLNTDSVSYELRPDEVYGSVDIIKDYLINILEKAACNGVGITISEFLCRSYITITTEIEGKLEGGRFTGNKKV